MKIEDITVLITSFRSKEKIYSCLQSIGTKAKIIIIENSNDIELKEKAESLYPNLQCILSAENLGYAKGNNLGLSKVKTKFALIINPDAYLDKDTFENFITAAKKIKNFSIIAPYIQEKKDENMLKKNELNKILEVDNVKGFAMFLKMDEFEDTGFFDENFFIYFEEIDLCKRLRKKNKKIFLDPNIKIFHAGGSSHDKEINNQMELSRNWHWMWSSFYFYKKHHGYFYALFKMIGKFVSAIFKIILFTLTFNKNKRNIYYQRFSGILNSMMLRKSWYRPKIF